MNIGGMEKCSLIDYPGKISAVIFTQGCNFRCSYCYNPELVFPTLFKEPIPKEQILSFLKKRMGKLQAVVITGGEPTMQKDLLEFMFDVKNLGFLIKLDTNGSNPEALKKIVESKAADYIAMDIKAPLAKYQKTICVLLNQKTIRESIKLIMNSGIDYEFRTTVVKSQLKRDDFISIGKMIKGARLYALQKFTIPPLYKINNPSFLKEKTYSDKEFEKIKLLVKPYIKECVVR